ncbi:MAG: hypothetical protein P9M14_04370 [Candidatus Alcyoniella australis]|nr:hypothetical protein [Candidatus Alcyoniella australis]
MDPRFANDVYVIRRKVLKVLGAAFHIFDSAEQLCFYTELKAFKLKEDIRVFTGEDKQFELLRIQARQILDISAAYDVFDSQTGEKVGMLQRKGLKSMLRDEYTICDATDQPIGMIQEDSTALALLRRFFDLGSLLPQKYTATFGDQVVAQYKQNFNPFVLKVTVDFSPDTGRQFDRRLGVASAIVLNAIEGRQN